ncbi:MAG: PAS domain S-box protein, partial [Desulfamplus sp.]|nr:PAS domain S-box protein [Desulfamplus sp.]
SLPTPLLKHSISTQLLSTVFAIYLIITITVTSIHLIAEFNNTQERIENELKILETIFRPGLSQSLWNMDNNQLEATLKGIMKIPIIVGVELEGVGKKQHKANGWIMAEDGTPMLIESFETPFHNKPTSFFNLFSHKFQVVYTDENVKQIVGRGTFYSNTAIVVNQVKHSFIFILVNAVIKTFSLWIIFFIVSRILLTRPLYALIQSAEQINLDNLDQIQINSKNKWRNELKVLEEALIKMVQKLLHARRELQNFNQSLEQKIKERTQQLQNKAEELTQKDILNQCLIKDIEMQREKFSKVFHSAPYAIAITDLYEGQFLEVNDSYVDMSGYQRSELIGKTGIELNLLKKEVRDAVVNKLLKGEKIEKMEGEMRRKSGERLMIMGSVQLISIHGKLCMIGSHADITELKMAHQSRLTAVSELISTIAHQWRQPLSTLGMIVQRTHAMAKMQSLTPEYLSEFKNNAMRQIKHMSDTIEVFRDFYRPEKEKSIFSPLSCIKDCIKLFEPQLAIKNIVADIHCEDCTEQLVEGFSNEFKQVILNLLGNARDAILESRNIGEPINQNVSMDEEKGRINVYIDMNRDNLMTIDITDNGCGIPDTLSSKLFSPYFTTKNDTAGTGIGLYMSRMIMQEKFKGNLRFIKRDQGATFRIELPSGTKVPQSGK